MFGQEPNPPVDFLLGRIPKKASGTISDWMWEHQKHLQTAFAGIREHTETAASFLKEWHDETLSEGQLDYLHDCSVRSRNKIQDV